MNITANLRTLQISVMFWAFMGLIGIPVFVFFDLFHGWRWTPHNAIYDQMIVSVYFGVGICAALAIRDPLRHASFLWFVVVSSLLHGAVMLFHALHNPTHRAHLLGDVLILAGALALALPLWRAQTFRDATQVHNCALDQPPR